MKPLSFEKGVAEIVRVRELELLIRAIAGDQRDATLEAMKTLAKSPKATYEKMLLRVLHFLKAGNSPRISTYLAGFVSYREDC